MTNGHSELTGNRQQHRPRLRVVLPLLIVCAAVIFFSIQDRMQEQSQRPEGGRKYSSPGPITAIEPAVRKVPSRPLPPAPPPSAGFYLPAERGAVEDSTPEGDEAEPAISSVAPPSRVIQPGPTAVFVASQTGGTVSGRVTLNGTPPPERDIPLDPSCARLRTDNKMTTRFFVVDERGGLGDVVVALAPLQNEPPLTSPIPIQSVLLDQSGCELVPYVMGLQVGQKLLVRNSDPMLHNVHVISSVPGFKEINRALLPGSPDLELIFDVPEMFLRIKCDLHPWMFAYLCLFEHGYFAVTQPDGSFQIFNVPPGEYVLIAAHRRLARITKPVTVHQGEISTVDFTLDIASLSVP